MEGLPNHPCYPANWGVRFLCDCKKVDKAINIHKGFAHEISSNSVRILSDHHICQQKKIAMHVLIPSLISGAPQKIVKIIGNSITTIMKEGKFLTEIEFLHFEEDGLKVLEKESATALRPAAFTHKSHNALRYYCTTGGETHKEVIMSSAISVIYFGFGLLFLYGIGVFALCLHAGENLLSSAIQASGWWVAFYSLASCWLSGDHTPLNPVSPSKNTTP